MKKFPWIASCTLLAAAVILRLLFPGAGKKLRDGISAMILSEEAAVFTGKSEPAEVLVFQFAEDSTSEPGCSASVGALANG